MKPGSPPVRIHSLFDRHERRYCFFSLKGDDDTFLYFSHKEKPLYSLIYGRNIHEKLPGLLENDNLCIECGLGLSVAGGVALDSGDCAAWNCTVEQANLVLAGLKEHLGETGRWIELFQTADRSTMSPVQTYDTTAAGPVAGLDIGSTRIKVVIYNGSSYIASMRDASWDPESAALDLLASASRDAGLPCPPTILATTGYGRRCLKIPALVFTEIATHAKGAFHLVPGCRFVVDIGGQDAKGIRLSAHGRVEDFVMNDKCAAGTGRFLSTMGQALGIPVENMGSHGAGTEPHRINAMCTVFAESEVISLINQGVDRNAIIAGLHASIARRTASMVASLHPEPPIVFTGGVSQNGDIARRLSQELDHPVIVPQDAAYAGAIGAALLAWEHREAGGKKED